MSGKTVRAFTVSILLLAGGMPASAVAPAPSETVTVTGTRLREVFQKFLRDFVAPTPFTGKIARWERRICPLVVGQNPHFTAFITQRIKYVAQAASTPVNTDASCTPNIEVVFTTTPQALLDNVRRHHVYYLGYAETNAQLDDLAKVTSPVQAWYATETTDNNGRRLMDSFIRSNANGQAQFEFGIEGYAASSSRINDGMKTGFNHVLIVIDSTKLAGQQIVPLADYISMLALTQVNSLATCQQLTSIVNILATDCDHKVQGLTMFDLAYLQGLYRMSASRGLMFQRNDIAAMMADAVTPEN
jgi:hypothetical protein